MDENLVNIDLTYFYAITGGDKAFEQLLLTGTIADIDDKISAFKNAWKAKDAASIRSNAHSLISLSAIVGITEIEDYSKRIDRAFGDYTFHPELSRLADFIIAAWYIAQVKLKALIAGISLQIVLP